MFNIAFHDGSFARGPSSNLRLVAGQHVTTSASDPISTGLTKVLAAVAVLGDDPVAGADRAIASVGDQSASPKAGSILLKTYKPTSVTSTVPTAATSFGKRVSWICVGY
jgi:hypothetical protein